MDDLLAAAGAENVDFPLKTACCGGAHTLSDSDTSTKLVLNILRAAEAAGADVIATECPTCHSGLEMHQVRAEKVLGEKTTVKMLYFTQLLGIALGLVAAQARRARERLGRLGLLKETRSLAIEGRTLARQTAREAGSLRGAWAAGARRGADRGSAVESFRLLALHRQGARGVPSFNACRETCREIAYHYNLLGAKRAATSAPRAMMAHAGAAPGAVRARQDGSRGTGRVLLRLAPLAATIAQLEERNRWLTYAAATCPTTCSTTSRTTSGTGRSATAPSSSA